MNWVAPIKDADTLASYKEVLLHLDHKYYIMFEIGIGTGMQLQDILKLKISDVLDKDELVVSIGTKRVLRQYKFSDELKSIIRDYCMDKNHDSLLIPVTREQAYRVLKSAGNSIGLASIGAQTMRKTFAYKYYKETNDIYYLQNMFNHATPSITYRFIGEKPNLEVVLNKQTPAENERSRYLLYYNNNCHKRINYVIDFLKSINDEFDKHPTELPFYGKVDSLLDQINDLIRAYKE